LRIFDLSVFLKVVIKASVFKHVAEYAALVDQVAPWHSRMNVMCKQFIQFSIACRPRFPPDYFARDDNLGTVGVHIHIAANFLHWLRFKGHASDATITRKVSTILNMFQETKSGLREQLAHSFPKPAWMTQGPKQFTVLRKLLNEWSRIDLQRMPPKAYLLQEQVEQFCMEAIWYYMQVD
jgi:hypothetical protein